MATRIRTIVVGVALVDELDPVLPSAIRLAQDTGARLHVVHVLRAPDQERGGRVLGSLHPDTGYLDRQSRATEEALLDQCRFVTGAGEVEIEIHVLTGSAHASLAGFAASRGAELLVIGSTRHGRIWRNILGTTAERVLRKATVPVLVMHQPFFKGVEKVLLTTDLTLLSAHAQESALDLVEGLFGADRLVCRSIFVLEYRVDSPGPEGAGSVEKLGEWELGQFLSEQRPRRYPVAPRVRVGDPSVEINVEADSWGADLIVLGTHGRNGLARYVFGSVAAAALRDAARNVLVVPPATPHAEGEPTPAHAATGAAW